MAQRRHHRVGKGLRPQTSHLTGERPARWRSNAGTRPPQPYRTGSPPHTCPPQTRWSSAGDHRRSQGCASDAHPHPDGMRAEPWTRFQGRGRDQREQTRAHHGLSSARWFAFPVGEGPARRRLKPARWFCRSGRRQRRMPPVEVIPAEPPLAPSPQLVRASSGQITAVRHLPHPIHRPAQNRGNLSKRVITVERGRAHHATARISETLIGVRPTEPNEPVTPASAVRLPRTLRRARRPHRCAGSGRGCRA